MALGARSPKTQGIRTPRAQGPGTFWKIISEDPHTGGKEDSPHRRKGGLSTGGKEDSQHRRKGGLTREKEDSQHRRKGGLSTGGKEDSAQEERRTPRRKGGLAAQEERAQNGGIFRETRNGEDRIMMEEIGKKEGETVKRNW